MTTQSVDPANTQIDQQSGLPLVNPNAAFNANVVAPQTTVPPANPAPAATPIPPAQAPGTPPVQPLAVSISPTPSTPTPTNQPESYVVQPGDTLSKIATKLGVSTGDISGYASGNPNLIKTGENLQVKHPSADTSQVDIGKQSAPLPAPNENGTGENSTLDTLLKTYGISKPDPTQDPVTHFVDNYTKVLTQLGIPTLKTQIDSVIKDEGDLKQELNDKIDELNNNPWLSSTSRSEEISKLKDRYTPKLQLATDQLNLYNSLYDKGISQGQFIMGQITADQKQQQADYNTVVGKAIDIAQKQLDAQTSLAKDNQVVSVGGRELLVNKSTGKRVADLGPSTKTGTGTDGSPSDVSGWVQAINNGTAKLSDLTSNPTLKNQVVTALGQGGSNANDILETTKQSLGELQTMVDKDQGFKGAVGSKLSFGTGFDIPFVGNPKGFPGTSEANFNAKLDQVKNDVILPNLKLLHGLGRVTDREFQALTSAVTSLSTNLSEGAFKNELKNITDRINSASGNTGGTPSAGTTSSGIKYTITK